MAGRAVRLLLAVVLAAVLFHPDDAAAMEGQEGFIPYHNCVACQMIRREVADRQKLAVSPANKVPAIIDKITGFAENNVCRPRKHWMLRLRLDVAEEEGNNWKLVVQDEEQSCNEECKTVESAFKKVMKDDDDIVDFIVKKELSIEQLMKILCEEGIQSVLSSAEGGEEDDSGLLSKWSKKSGGIIRSAFTMKRRQTTEKPTDLACKNIEAIAEVLNISL